MTAVAATAATLRAPASFSPSGADHVLLYWPVSLLKYSSYAPFCTAYLHAHHGHVTASNACCGSHSYHHTWHLVNMTDGVTYVMVWALR